jgi:hypothetical protein
LGHRVQLRTRRRVRSCSPRPLSPRKSCRGASFTARSPVHRPFTRLRVNREAKSADSYGAQRTLALRTERKVDACRPGSRS